VIHKNITDYVKVYKNHLPSELCKSAVASLKKVNWEPHYFNHAGSNTFTTYNDDLDFSFDTIPEKETIDKQVWFAIEQYIMKDFSSFSEWFSGWVGYSGVRFNKYDPQTRMKIHCDHIHTLFDGERKGIPILTVLGGLNDDYEGGELFMFKDHHIHLPAGAVVVFPSNFMFPHEVKPVKSGIRYSYVSWTW
jgi:hypothetical protein